MARTIIWLLAVLLASAVGLPKPAAADATFEFIQTSDPATSDGLVAQGTLVISNSAYLYGEVNASLYPPGPAYGSLAGIEEFDFNFYFGVDLYSFVPAEPSTCVSPETGDTCYIWDISAGRDGAAFDYCQTGYFDWCLAFNGALIGISGGVFLLDPIEPLYFDGYWQLVGAAPVPEPASLGLLASGVLGLAVLRRRKSARKRERAQ
jgi:hypothetical protein